MSLLSRFEGRNGLREETSFNVISFHNLSGFVDK